VIAPGQKFTLSSSPNHQNNSHVPTLNQMAARMKLPKHRWEIALSHAMTVKQKANQKNNIMGMRTAAMRPIASPTRRVAPAMPGEGAAVRRAGTAQGCAREQHQQHRGQQNFHRVLLRLGLRHVSSVHLTL